MKTITYTDNHTGFLHLNAKGEAEGHSWGWIPFDQVHPNTTRVYQCTETQYVIVNGPLPKGHRFVPVKMTTTVTVEADTE